MDHTKAATAFANLFNRSAAAWPNTTKDCSVGSTKLQSDRLLAQRIIDKKSRGILTGVSGGKQIHDLLNGFVGAVVGGFEFAGRLVSGVGAVVKAAVGEGPAEPFVKEQKEQRNLDAFWREPVGVARAVAL
jgi:hypothetical protein